MNQDTRRTIEATIDLCLQAKRSLGPHGSAHTHLLLDMLLFDLGKQLALRMRGSAH